jgi:alkylation response protein AidB-like acyl-CoA dehydrogenase
MDLQISGRARPRTRKSHTRLRSATPIGITTDHESMFKVAAAWNAKTHALAITRRLLDGEDVTAEVTMLRAEAHVMGWTGLLISEDLGGSGQTLAEAAVLVEALGSSCAPLSIVQKSGSWNLSACNCTDRNSELTKQHAYSDHHGGVNSQSTTDQVATRPGEGASGECGHLTWPHFGRRSSRILAPPGW